MSAPAKKVAPTNAGNTQGAVAELLNSGEM